MAPLIPPPSTDPQTKADFHALAVAAVQKYATLLGIETSWHWRFSFDTESLDGKAASVTTNQALQTAHVRFHDRLNPAYYEECAAHEAIHVLLSSIECAVDELAEPSKTLMSNTIHATVDRLGFALSRTEFYWPGDQLGDKPPWE